MLEAPEEVGVEEGQFDAIPDALHGFGLAADGLPGNRLDARKGPVEASGPAEHLDRHAVLAVQSDVHAQLELFLGQERGTDDDGVRNAGFVSDPQRGHREQLGDPDHRPVFLNRKTSVTAKASLSKTRTPVSSWASARAGSRLQMSSVPLAQTNARPLGSFS